MADNTDTNTRPRVLLAGFVNEKQFAELREVAPGADFHLLGEDEKLEEQIVDADIAAGSIPPAALANARSLKWVHSWAAGPNSQLYPAMVESDVVLTCSKGNGAVPLAEHAMMLMLMLNRNAMRWIRAQAERKWDPFMHDELAGKTCAILGTGYSGQDLAAKAKAFHMRTVGLRRSAEETPGFDKMYAQGQLHEFLAEADYLVVTAPNTPETQGMLGEAEFRAMKPTACYLCYSRGGIADDDVLLRALREKWIAGAGLDAHGTEPLPEDSPFWDIENVIITPHNGATTPATKRRGYEVFRDNMRCWMAGENLINVVDKRLGY